MFCPLIFWNTFEPDIFHTGRKHDAVKFLSNPAHSLFLNTKNGLLLIYSIYPVEFLVKTEELFLGWLFFQTEFPSQY